MASLKQKPGHKKTGLSLSIQKAPQLSRTAGVLELAKRLGFDLANPLAGDVELLPNLLQRVIGIHPDPETHAQNALFPRCQGRQNPRGRFPQIGMDCAFNRQNRVFVLNEITQR